MANGKNGLIYDAMSEKIIAVAGELATSLGAENVTVTKILNALGITNRVFYNRFRNIDEVLTVVYENTAVKIRDSIIEEFNPRGDFFAQVIDIVATTLRLSYLTKKNLSEYVFRSDSVSNDNYEWWKSEIIKLVEFGKKEGYLKDVDSDAVSYAVWCFIRGYNADALGRGLPEEEAVEKFKYSFGIFLSGMKA